MLFFAQHLIAFSDTRVVFKDSCISAITNILNIDPISSRCVTAQAMFYALASCNMVQVTCRQFVMRQKRPPECHVTSCTSIQCGRN